MWEICKGVLKLVDGCFNVIDEIWRFKFFDNTFVNDLLSGAIIVACAWLMLKVILDLLLNHIIKNDGRRSPTDVFRGVALAIVVMFSISALFNFGHKFSTYLTEAIISYTAMSNSGDVEGLMSSALIRSMVNEDEMEAEKIPLLIEYWRTLDINATNGGLAGIGDRYTFSVNFFMLIILSLITIFLLFFVAIQMAKRVMELALFKIIGPFCCTSIAGNSKAFDTWASYTIGLFLITSVQFVSIGLLLEMFKSAFSQATTMTSIFLVIGALLFIITTPTLISSLLNQQSGIMGGFGDLQSMVALGRSAGSALSVGGGLAMSALSSGAKVVGAGANALSSAGNGLASGVKNIYGGLKNNISSMLTKKVNFTKDQMDTFKGNIDRNNIWKSQMNYNKFSGNEFNRQNSPNNINNTFRKQQARNNFNRRNM